MTLKNNTELLPNSLSCKRAILEVYKTDEENFVPYRSGDENTTEESDEEETEESSDEEEETDETDEDGFTLHQGEILETFFYKEPFEISFGKDYEGLSGEGKFKIKFSKGDMPKVYKGVR